MDPQKLFRVMVVGGALLVGCREEDLADAGDDRSSDSGAPQDVGAAPDVAAADGGGEPMDCGLCPNTECCVTDGSGVAHEREGMMCCWGTSC